MRFYLATSFIFPRSLRLRLFTLCFATTHMPLIAYSIWGLATGRIELADFVLLTLATVFGTILALLGIGALLNPIHTLADSLHQADSPVLPEAMDVIQSLYAGVHRAARATDARLQSLEAAAHEDPLTGALNRRGFLHEVNALIEQGARGGVALIDVDHFKAVNDTLGHDEGDRILKALASELVKQTRRVDLVARWGGEEFALFLPDCAEDVAADILTRIARALQQQPIGVVAGRPVTVSGGTSQCDDGNLEAALARADAALYAAKHGGRNRVMTQGSLARSPMEA